MSLLTKIKSSDVELKEAYRQVLNSTISFNRLPVFKDLLQQDVKELHVTLFELMLDILKDDISHDISMLIFNKFLSILPEKYNLCIIENLFKGELWKINELFFGKIPNGASPRFMLEAKSRMTEEIRKLQTRSSNHHYHSFGFSDYNDFNRPIFRSSGFYQETNVFNKPVFRSLGPPGGLEFNNCPVEVKTAFVTPDLGKEQVFHNVKNFLKKMTSVVKINIYGEPLDNEVENDISIFE